MTMSEKIETVTGEEIRQMMVDQGWNFVREHPAKKRLRKAMPQLASRLRPPYIWYVMDRQFILCDEKQIWDHIKKDYTNLLKYQAEIGDCDNYAFELRNSFGRQGLAMGILVVMVKEGPHAIFFYANKDHKVVPVEPQDDSIFTRPFVVTGVIMY